MIRYKYMDKPLDIKLLTVIDLKALKSDIYEAISLQQQNLSIINQELVNRSKLDDKPASTDKED